MGTQKADPDAMTPVIGLHFKEGILMFSDTTETISIGDTSVAKQDFRRKLHFVTDNYAFGFASSSSDQIDAFRHFVTSELKKQRQLLDEEEMYKLLHEQLIPSFLEKDREIAQKMYGKEIRRKIGIDAIFAARLKESHFALYQITLHTHGEGVQHDYTWEKKIGYGSVGTGAGAVDPLMNETLHVITKHGYMFGNWSLRLAALYCHLLLKFASDTDANTGKRVSGIVMMKDTSRNVTLQDYVNGEDPIWLQFLTEAFREMPYLYEEIPFDKIITSLPRPTSKDSIEVTKDGSVRFSFSNANQE